MMSMYPRGYRGFTDNFAATLEEGSKVLAPGPHYPPYMAYPQMYGAKTIEYALKSDDGWGIDLDDIESKMDSMFACWFDKPE